MPVTLAEEHAGPDAGYYGDQGDWIIIAAQHRDSEPIERANFLAATRMINREGVPQEQLDVSQSGHFLVGWVEYLIARPTATNIEIANEIAASLDDYPVLDDEILSEIESTEGAEAVAFAITDQLAESPANLDPDAIEQVAWIASEADGTGHWDTDQAYDSAGLDLYRRDRGSRDRKHLALAIRHYRHAEAYASIWNCEHCN